MRFELTYSILDFEWFLKSSNMQGNENICLANKVKSILAKNMKIPLWILIECNQRKSRELMKWDWAGAKPPSSCQDSSTYKAKHGRRVSRVEKGGETVWFPRECCSATCHAGVRGSGINFNVGRVCAPYHQATLWTPAGCPHNTTQFCTTYQERASDPAG